MLPYGTKSRIYRFKIHDNRLITRDLIPDHISKHFMEEVDLEIMADFLPGGFRCGCCLFVLERGKYPTRISTPSRAKR